MAKLTEEMNWQVEGYIGNVGQSVSDDYQINFLARALAMYDEPTWQKLRRSRKATYMRAAATLLFHGKQILDELEGIRQGRDYRTKNDKTTGAI